MILLFGLAFLLLALCFASGTYIVWVIQKQAGELQAKQPLFLTMLCGFAAMASLCNIWSLFLPVNFICLLVVLLINIWLVSRPPVLLNLRALQVGLSGILSAKSLAYTLSFTAVFVIFAILSPQHGDSPGYHYASIRWIEEYKVVPGLANIHGRFGFNSSFFTTSAAFSLTRLTGQALYPLNIGFTAAFFAWLLNRVVIYKAGLKTALYALIILLMVRGMILTISSPTPDIIATNLQFFILVDVGDRLINRQAFSTTYKIQIAFLILFAATVKLSCIFLLPVIGLVMSENKFSVTGKTLLGVIAGAAIIILPWLARNFLLTGYLIYPIAITGFLHPDWQAPLQVLHFDKLLINNGPKMISSEWEKVDSLPIFKWFPLWIKANLSNGLAASLAILVLSGISCAAGMIKAFSTRHYRFFALLGINALAIMVWLITSPDYRFAYGYLVAAIALPWQYILGEKKIGRIGLVLVNALYLGGCMYYIHYGKNYLSAYSIARYWLKPAPPVELTRHNNLQTFKWLPLAPAIKLYVEDASHDCNNGNLPCFQIFFQELKPEWIEARGNSVTDGFRMKKGSFTKRD